MFPRAFPHPYAATNKVVRIPVCSSGSGYRTHQTIISRRKARKAAATLTGYQGCSDLRWWLESLASSPLRVVIRTRFGMRLTLFPASAIVHHESVGPRPMIDVGYLGHGAPKVSVQHDSSGIKLVRLNFWYLPFLLFYHLQVRELSSWVGSPHQCFFFFHVLDLQRIIRISHLLLG
jgi:hypothetical protein